MGCERDSHESSRERSDKATRVREGEGKKVTKAVSHLSNTSNMDQLRVKQSSSV